LLIGSQPFSESKSGACIHRYAPYSGLQDVM
jgi:hypothetical protein